jgi:hypothetical protein
MSFGYGNPYSFYDPFMYDPFYSDYGYYGYGSYYSPWSYGGYYGGYYNPYYYSSFYNPYYSNWGYSNAVYNRDYNSSIAYGRRERQSTYSTKWNNNMQPSASSRRDGYISKGTSGDGVRRSPSGSSNAIANDTRRPVSTTVNNQQALNAADRKVYQSASKTATTRSSTVSKPEYNTVNRTYTPSYSNPRMSTRPSYNNSRVSTESSGSGNYRSSNVRTRQDKAGHQYLHITIMQAPIQLPLEEAQADRIHREARMALPQAGPHHHIAADLQTGEDQEAVLQEEAHHLPALLQDHHQAVHLPGDGDRSN